MQIVIDILPEEYEAICKVDSVVNVIPFRIAQAIKNGTVLPENHGRLIDLDALCDEHLFGGYIELAEHEISKRPVIIEGTEGKERQEKAK